MGFLRTLWMLVILAGLAVHVGFAQDDANLESGFKEFGSFHSSEVDSVSLSSGNVILHVPLWSYPQRGNLNLQFYLRLNSKNWHVVPAVRPKGEHSSETYYKWDSSPSAPLGVTLTSNRSIRVLRSLQTVENATVGGVVSQLARDYSVQTPDGASHPLVAFDNNGSRFITSDTSGYTFVLQSDGSYWNDSGIVTDRSGTQYQLGAFSEVSSSQSLDALGQFLTIYAQQSAPATTVTDTNGNTLTALEDDGWSRGIDHGWSDSLGRIIGNAEPTTDFSDCVGPSITSAEIVHFPNPVNGDSPVKFCYSSIFLQTQFSAQYANQGIMEFSGSTGPYGAVVTTVVLPNRTKWTFTYDSYGNVSNVQLPTGGLISYEWQTIDACRGNGSRTPVSRAVHRRIVDAVDGTGQHAWTYTWQATLADGTVGNIVSDPAGNDSTHVFTYRGACSPYEIDSRVYQGAAGQQPPLKQVVTAYSTYSNPEFNDFPSQTDTFLNGTKISSVQKQYDSTFSVPRNGASTAITVGAVTQEAVYDGVGNLVRKTVTDYKFIGDSAYRDANMLDLPSYSEVQDGSGNRAARTDYGYDENQAQPSGVTVHHVSVPPGTVRGNQTSASRWWNTYPANPATTTSSFYDTGALKESTDAGEFPRSNNRHTTTYSYDARFAGAYATQVCNAKNQCTTYDYDLNTGLQVSATDANGKTTRRIHDLMWRTIETDAPDGGQVKYTYSDTVPPTVTAAVKLLGTSYVSTRAEVDGLGRVRRTISLSDPRGPVYTQTGYDALGRKAFIYNPTRCDPDVQPNSCTGETTFGKTIFDYDALGRTRSIVNSDGSYKAVSYAANCTTATDEAMKQRTSCADALGSLTQVLEPNPAGGSYATNYRYDALGNLKCVEQQGGVPGTGCDADESLDSSSRWRVRRFNYDSLSRLTSAKNPESGTIFYSYDADGNVIAKTDARPQNISYCYDQLHRLTGKRYSGSVNCNDLSQLDVAYTFDVDNGLPAGYPIGRRTGMRDASGTTAWKYDAMGRVAQIHRGIGTETRDINYTYWANGAVGSIQYPSGRYVTYDYNSGGRAIVANYTVDSVSKTNYVNGATYAPGGQLIHYLNGPASFFSGIVIDRIYNSRLQPITLSASTPGYGATPPHTIYSLSYDFHLGQTGAQGNNGNVYQIIDNLDGMDPNRPSGTVNFTYDALNRIATAATAGSDCTVTVNGLTKDWGESFSIDAWGNLTKVNVTKCSALQFEQTVDGPENIGTNRFNSPSSYDAAGNMTENGQYAYDAENRLKTVGASIEYGYDGDGQRVEKCSPPGPNCAATKLYWYGAGGEVLTESGSDGKITSEYMYFNGQRVARQDLPNGPTGWGPVHYYFADHLGSTRVVTDFVGTTEHESQFYPYGGERVIVAGESNEYKFTVKERDAETGLDYFGARYYASNMGRFLSPDEFTGGPVDLYGPNPNDVGPLPYANIFNPQSLNKYSYAYNNPLRYKDPDGHEPIGLCGENANCTQKTDSGGNTTVQVTDSKTKTVQNADGTTTVTTTTTTKTYTFNAAGNMTGGQQQVQVSSATVSPTGATQWHTNTTTTPLSFGSAVGQFGAANLTSFQNSFLDPRGFWGTTGTELKNRPFKYGAAALYIGAGVTCLVAPCQEFTPALVSAGFTAAGGAATAVDEVQNATH